MAKEFLDGRYVAKQPEHSDTGEAGAKSWLARVNLDSGYGSQKVIEVFGTEREIVRISANAIAAALNKAMGV